MVRYDENHITLPVPVLDKSDKAVLSPHKNHYSMDVYHIHQILLEQVFYIY